MNASSNIFLGDQILFHHLLDQDCGWDTSISIIRNVAIFCGDKYFISFLAILSGERFERCSNSSFGLLASIIDGSVQHINSTAHYHQFDCIINIKVGLIIWCSNVCAKSHRGQFQGNMHRFSKMSRWYYTMKLKYKLTRVSCSSSLLKPLSAFDRTFPLNQIICLEIPK